MVPTLLVGDYLFVSKFSYGYSRYSLPFGLPLFSGRIFCSSRQSAAMSSSSRCRPTTRPITSSGSIGLPGDQIQMRHGDLYINDKLVPRQKVRTSTCPDNGFDMCVLYSETLPNGVTHPIIKKTDRAARQHEVFTVPPGDFFMMGDNRDNSSDSRVAFGANLDMRSEDQLRYVPAENLVGKAQFIFFSTDGSAGWWEFWKWPFAIRYGRLLDAGSISDGRRSRGICAGDGHRRELPPISPARSATTSPGPSFWQRP